MRRLRVPVLGGYMASGGGNTKLSNHPTTDGFRRGAGGAAGAFDLKQMRVVSVVLNDADFHTAEQMARELTKRWARAGTRN